MTLDYLLRASAPSGSTPTTVLPSLSIRGKTWYDGDKVYVHRLVSYLSALRSNRTESDWHAYFNWAAKTGFKGVRTFGGFRVDQMPMDALALLPRYLEVATEHGMVVEFTALTGTGDMDYNPKEYIHQSAEIIKPFKGHVILELANEYEHGSQNLELEDLIAWGKEYCGGLCWAVGAPPEDEPTPEGVWNGAGGTYGCAHLDRGRPTPWEQGRRVREIYACTDTGTPVLDNEPTGADELDGDVTGKQRCDDPAFFAVLGSLDRGFPGVGGVHHNQAGLDAVLPGPVQQKCAEAYITAHLAVDRILGGNVPQYKNSGHTDSPVLAFEGATREYSFTCGNFGATVGVGEQIGVKITWGNGFTPRSTVYDIVAKDGCHLVVREVGR